MIQTESLSSTLAMYKRRIRCPRNYVLKPGGQPFVIEINPKFKFLKDADAKIFGINKYRRKKDKFGNFIQNFKDYYQPEISAGWAKEHIYQAVNPICQQCKRCVNK